MFDVKNSLKISFVAVSLLFGVSLGAVDFKSATNTKSAKPLLMATTTSTDNTGLLDYLAPLYEKDTNVELKWVAVGTGAALKLGENCDASILFVHSPAAEKEYIKNGFGIDRTPVMFNDFVIIGAPKYKKLFANKNISEVFKIIENEKIKFISRGDKSGTDNKEKAVWKSAVGAVPEKQSWYLEAGQGMIATIQIAEEQQGLTLTDRGTYIKYEDTKKGNPPLVIVLEGDDNLKNFYSVMAVNPKNCPNADYEGAKNFTKWIVSDKAQKQISEFKLLDKQLFTPDANTRGN